MSCRECYRWFVGALGCCVSLSEWWAQVFDKVFAEWGRWPCLKNETKACWIKRQSNKISSKITGVIFCGGVVDD